MHDPQPARAKVQVESNRRKAAKRERVRKARQEGPGAERKSDRRGTEVAFAKAGRVMAARRENINARRALACEMSFGQPKREAREVGGLPYLVEITSHL